MEKNKSNTISDIIIIFIVIIMIVMVFLTCWYKFGRNESKQTFLDIKESKTSEITSGQEMTETEKYESTENQTTTETAQEQTSAENSTATEMTTENEGTTYKYAYAGMNPEIADTSVPFNRLLVNRDYILPDNFPVNLTSLSEIGSSEKLDTRVVPHYIKMYNAAKADGITLTPVSGYRTIERQRTNYEKRIARYQSQGYSKAESADLAAQVILPPGTSEHNAGLAMDIISLETSFENTAAFRWLTQHAADYGFIMRYPKDKTDITKITYEPWHWRYVGVDIAKEIKASGKTLEEYLGTV